MHGRTSNGILTLTLTLDDFTPKNTEVYQREGSTFTTYRGLFQTSIFVNGAAKWAVNRTFGAAEGTTTGELAPYVKDSNGSRTPATPSSASTRTPRTR